MRNTNRQYRIKLFDMNLNRKNRYIIISHEIKALISSTIRFIWPQYRRTLQLNTINLSTNTSPFQCHTILAVSTSTTNGGFWFEYEYASAFIICITRSKLWSYESTNFEIRKIKFRKGNCCISKNQEALFPAIKLPALLEIRIPFLN